MGKLLEALADQAMRANGGGQTGPPNGQVTSTLSVLHDGEPHVGPGEHAALFQALMDAAGNENLPGITHDRVQEEIAYRLLTPDARRYIEDTWRMRQDGLHIPDRDVQHPLMQWAIRERQQMKYESDLAEQQRNRYRGLIGTMRRIGDVGSRVAGWLMPEGWRNNPNGLDIR